MKIMKNKIITVLDFEVGRVFQYKIGVNVVVGHVEYLTNRGHNLSNCEWMVHETAQVITAEDYREVVMNNK